MRTADAGRSPMQQPHVDSSDAQPSPGASRALAAASSPVPDYPVDALVSSMASLIFVTTGHAACAALDEFPNQISLTPTVALRIAEVLRCLLQYPELGSRSALVDQWNEDEEPYIPHGRVLVDPQGARIGIEPLGAGVMVPALWEHVPALVLQLEQVAEQLASRP